MSAYVAPSLTPGKLYKITSVKNPFLLGEEYYEFAMYIGVHSTKIFTNRHAFLSGKKIEYFTDFDLQHYIFEEYE